MVARGLDQHRVPHEAAAVQALHAALADPARDLLRGHLHELQRRRIVRASSACSGRSVLKPRRNASCARTASCHARESARRRAARRARSRSAGCDSGRRIQLIVDPHQPLPRGQGDRAARRPPRSRDQAHGRAVRGAGGLEFGVSGAHMALNSVIGAFLSSASTPSARAVQAFEPHATTLWHAMRPTPAAAPSRPACDRMQRARGIEHEPETARGD